MQRYILRRLVEMAIMLLALSMLVFLVSRATGDPVKAMLPADADQEMISEMRAELKLDQPFPVQYWYFISNAMRGDLGDSIVTGTPVLERFFNRLPASGKLIAAVVFFALLISFPLAIIAARRRGTAIDSSVTFYSALGLALPHFWIGLILMAFFAVHLGWLPAAGIGGIQYYILPVVSYSNLFIAQLTRLLRSNLLEVMDKEFITMAQAKGVSELMITLKHVLKNSIAPTITFVGMMIPVMVTGAVVIETVFAWPGVGRLAYQSVLVRDFPMVQCIVLMVGSFVIVANLLVDISYALLDPRVRYR